MPQRDSGAERDDLGVFFTAGVRHQFRLEHDLVRRPIEVSSSGGLDGAPVLALQRLSVDDRHVEGPVVEVQLTESPEVGCRQRFRQGRVGGHEGGRAGEPQNENLPWRRKGIDGLGDELDRLLCSRPFSNQ